MYSGDPMSDSGRGGAFATGGAGRLPRRDVPLDMIRYRDRGHIPVSCKRVRNVVGESNRFQADPGCCGAVEYLSGNKRAHASSRVAEEEDSGAPKAAARYLQPRSTSTLPREVAFSRPVSNTPDLYMSSMLVTDEDSHAHLLPNASINTNGKNKGVGSNAYRPLSTTPSPGLHTTRGASSATNRNIRLQKGSPSSSLLAEEAEYSRAPDSILNVLRDSVAQGGFARQRHIMSRDGQQPSPQPLDQVRARSTSIAQHPVGSRSSISVHRASPDPLLFSQRSNVQPDGRGPSAEVFPEVQRGVIQPRLRFERNDFRNTNDIVQPAVGTVQFLASNNQFGSSDRGLRSNVIGAHDKEHHQHVSIVRAARHHVAETSAIHNVEVEVSKFRARRPPL